MGDPEELEMVVPVDVLVQRLEYGIQAERHLERMERKGRYTLERDSRDDSERAEADAGDWKSSGRAWAEHERSCPSAPDEG